MSLRTPVHLLAFVGFLGLLFNGLYIGLYIYHYLSWENFDNSKEERGQLQLASRRASPEWFPDGRHLAFTHLGAIYVVDSEGLHLQKIDGGADDFGHDFVGLAFAPDVSPDGTQIAYSVYGRSGWFPGFKSESWEIALSSADGSNKRLITSDGLQDSFPVWSPDGRLVHFVTGEEIDQIKTIRVGDNSDLSAEGFFVVSTGPFIYGSPVLSPNGDRMAFMGLGGDRENLLFVVRPDGTELTKLASYVGYSPWSYAGPPAWSPDGQRLAFAVRELGNTTYPYTPAAGIYTVEANGSEPREIISFSSIGIRLHNSISWSPDGSEILFGTRIIAADGSTMRDLNRPGNHTSWSPGGSHIAVYAYAGSNSRIVLYTMEADGSGARTLVEVDETGTLVAAKARPLTFPGEDFPIY